MQMVRTGPHIGENQSPEVHHRQPIRIDRPAGLLRHEVVHHAQEGSGQEEADRIVTVPPLHHRILYASIGGIGFRRQNARGKDRDFRAVDQVQNGDGDNERGKKPVRHVDVRNLANRQGAEEHNRVRHPNNGNQDIDWPFEFGVFLTRRKTQRETQRSEQNNQLPAPERKSSQPR